jgi:hypothetical protein
MPDVQHFKKSILFILKSLVSNSGNQYFTYSPASYITALWRTQRVMRATALHQIHTSDREAKKRAKTVLVPRQWRKKAAVDSIY